MASTVANNEDPDRLTPFEMIVKFVSPSRGTQVKPAAVAAALLIASDQLDRHQACEHCKIPEGGARSRVGKMAKYFRYLEYLNCWIPGEWLPSQTGSSA